jgi:hypothetical protein
MNRSFLVAAVHRARDGVESRVSGSSMEPAIPDGATIRVLPEPAGGYQIGMVVACLSAGEELFAHRLVRRGRNHGAAYVLTLGDNWLLCDPPTAIGDIIGLVSAYKYDGVWRSPPNPRRSWLSQKLSQSSVTVVWLALQIHPGFARRLAGTLLRLTSLLSTVRSQIGWR